MLRAMSEPASVHEFCLRLLRAGDLPTKLVPPGELPDEPRGPAEDVAAPGREPGLELRGGSEPLPRPGQLADPAARARCLARFAHHELMVIIGLKSILGVQFSAFRFQDNEIAHSL